MTHSNEDAVNPSATTRFAPESVANFRLGDWGLLAGAAVGWGSSFLFIDIAVEHFRPGLVAFLRVLFGALVLAAMPGARRAVTRSDWPLIALLGVVWMAAPFVLFAFALQWIDSSVAGMINAAAPCLPPSWLGS